MTINIPALVNNTRWFHMVDSHKHCPYNMIKVYAGT